MKNLLADSVYNLPLVSVIIPVRNGKEFIFEAIESVLQQNYKSIEILVIDDGSNDFDYSTLQEEDSRIRVIRLPGNGVSCARNVGMNASCGDLIAFLDADDVWLPGKIMAQVSCLQEYPEVGVVFGKFIKWSRNDSGEFLPAADYVNEAEINSEVDFSRSGWIYCKLLLGLLVGMNTAMIRRNVLLNIGGFNESMSHGEDYDFWLRCSRVTLMYSLNHELALYRVHDSSAMHRLSEINHLDILLNAAQLRWGLSNVDESIIQKGEFNRRLGEVNFMFAYSHFWHGDIKSAQRGFKTSMLRGFLPLRSSVYYILACLKMIKLKFSS
jgi:glycosyltransferase involved in cell wall biosynthesis